tara:strand:- start:3132 stop:4952 length:1821 start_codon:yes stop_codon:yes gene_type:complete
MLKTTLTSKQVALAWHRAGCNTIPIIKGTKVPATSWKTYTKIRTTEDDINAWWEYDPDKYDVGIVTGEVSRISMIDLDVKDNKSGVDTAKELGITLPNNNVLILKTPRGGWHIYVAYDERYGTNSNVQELIDTRNNDGYAKVHGSNEDGGKYSVLRGEISRQYFPKYFDGKLIRPKPQSTQNTQSTMSVNEGNRNDSLASLGGKLIKLGIKDFEEMLAVATIVNDTYNPPLAEAEVRQVVKSIHSKYQNKKSFNLVKGTHLMKNKKKKEWLWDKWFPKGQITIVSGYEGKGKSYAMMDILSRITNGSPFPDGAPTKKGNVIYFGFEDGVYDDLPYRMEKCGTNPENFIAHDWENVTDSISIQDEATIEEMKEAIKEAEATMVVIDPFRNLIPNVNDSKETIIGEILQRVSQVAKETNTAIVLIRHWGKDTQSKGTATHLQLGSVTYGARARSLINVIPIKEDGEEDKYRKLWKQDKPSNSGFPDPFIFTIDDEGIRWEKADDDVDTINSLSGGKTYLKEDCANAVLTILKNGAMDSGAVRETLIAEPYEYTKKTIKNAVSILSSDGKIKTKKLSTGHMLYALPEYSFDSLRPEGTEGTLEIGDIEL